MLYIGGNYTEIYNYNDLMKCIKHILNSGGNCLQIFIGMNTSTTTSKNQKAYLTDDEFSEIKRFLKKNKMKIFIHSSLSLNLCNPIRGKYQWIINNLIYDIEFGNKIGCDYIVVHLGNEISDRYKNNENAYKNFVLNLTFLYPYLDKMKILIETSAGQKNKIGTSLEELNKLYKMIKNKDKIGFCIDTCHIFSAGYDIRNRDVIDYYFKTFDKYFSLNNIKLIHLNDSKLEFNSRHDVHTNLGKGHIFKNNIENLKYILKKIKNIPIILETRDPYKYKFEINLIKKMIT